MVVQIGAKPDSGFDDPIGMLRDCHRKIENFLGVLYLVAECAKDRSLTGEERNAVETALHYFREESMFPRLRAFGTDSLEEIDRLEDDHREAGYLHESVEDLYSKWIGSGGLRPEDALQLSSKTERLKQLYATHIQVEETIVFTHAARVLDGHTMKTIGSEFQMRRQ